jgi:hypothetical protein
MTDPFKGTKLMFSDIIGPHEIIFAWWPVKCFDGTWTWLKPVCRRLCLIKPYLANGRNEDPWWQYARPIKDTDND